MRYVSFFDHENRRGVGEVTSDQVVLPLAGVRQIDKSTSTDLLRAAPRLGDSSFSLADANLAPVSEPARIICVGLNYRTHIEETKRDDSDYPVLFTKFASSLIGAHENIRVPSESQQVDYEGELVVVIGRAGRRIRAESAMEHVLGFTIANDITMRDYQYKTHQWLQGKSWDHSTPTGPVIVEPDEFVPGEQMLTTTVNGEVVQSSTLNHMIFSVEHLISTISEFTVLEPGDLILTGTPGGVGFRRDPQLFLQHGDKVTVEIGGIGAVSNHVRAE